MHSGVMRFVIALLFLVTGFLRAQAPGVPIYDEAREVAHDPALLASVRSLFQEKILPPREDLLAQMSRTHCALKLPEASHNAMTSRGLWKQARQSHLRVGWAYRCTKCDDWHLDLAGGYAVTGSAVATCGHVLQEPRNMKEGGLVAADDKGRVFAVTEILALNRALDCALLRLSTETLSPLPLSTDVYPGDEVYCFSDPMGRQGFFSEGVVTRFVKRPFLRPKEQAELGDKTSGAAIFIQVTNDWAPGSSGSALLDGFGNAVGHVSEIQSVLEEPRRRRPAKGESGAAKPEPARGTLIIFHDAISAANLLQLIDPQR